MDATVAPTWRPFAVCQREPVTSASPKNVHFTGVAALTACVKKVVKRPIFANLSRQRPWGKDDEPRWPARAK